MDIRLPYELMLFVSLAGVVVLMAAWTLARWARGGRDTDPAARLLAAVALAVLGWMVGAGPWTWLGEQWGAWFWLPFAAAAALFVADTLRGRRPRRRPPGGGQVAGSGGGSPAAARERSP
jgi:dolichyl-phosphate-mannose--protein O-mannosyl transferase